MADDGIAEQEAILARVAALVPSGTAFDEMADLTVLVADPDTGGVPDYAVVAFGEPFLLPNDHSMTGVQDQPLRMPIFVDYWSESPKSAREGAGAVRSGLNGFVPVEGNSTGIVLGGGGSFTRKNSVGRPTRYLRLITGYTDINQSITDPDDTGLVAPLEFTGAETLTGNPNA